MAHVSVFILSYLILQVLVLGEQDDGKSVEEEMYGVKYAQECEVCKYFVIELEDRLKETGKSHEVLETGYELDPAKRKRKKYQQSEVRLLDSLDGICEKLLTYNIHKERKDSTRFAKGMSTTFKVLHDLVDKGVKVDLGIPLELWDQPSAEITNLKSQCENLLEKHESDIEDWYFNHQDVPLKQFLCIDRALHRSDTGCLDEILYPKPENNGKDEKSAKKKKGKKHSDKNSKKEETTESKKGDSADNVQNAKTEL